MCTILGPNALIVLFVWFVKFDKTNNFSLKIHPIPILKLLHLFKFLLKAKEHTLVCILLQNWESLKFFTKVKAHYKGVCFR
jgi:hypothetical protein